MNITMNSPISASIIQDVMNEFEEYQVVINANSEMKILVDRLQKHFENDFSSLRFLYQLNNRLRDYSWEIRDLNGNRLFYSLGDDSSK